MCVTPVFLFNLAGVYSVVVLHIREGGEQTNKTQPQTRIKIIKKKANQDYF